MTCNRPRVSYRIQAFFWNPGGVDTGSRVRLLGRVAGFGFLRKAVSNRKQTAVGFEAGWQARRGIHPRNSRVIHRKAWPEPGPDGLERPGSS